MSTLDFKTHIKNIREEALKLGYSRKTIKGYKTIWNQYIEWKKEDVFIYDSNEYSFFLLEHYNFDIHTYSNKSKSRHQELMRSKRILDDFDLYSVKKRHEMFPNTIYRDYPNSWNTIIDNYINYCKEVRQNSNRTIKIKKDYLKRELSYFYSKGLESLNKFAIEYINTYINNAIKAGNVSKRRNFYILREFLNYLFIEDIMNIDLSEYIPKISNKKRKKLPIYLKQDKIEELLNSINKNTKYEIRDFAIILIAARLGLRISDILNIKLKDIDWQNKKLNILQPKTNHLNTLPLSKEVGWAIIDYIKNSRPKCDNEYLFVKMRYPFDRMISFNSFRKYFDKTDIEIDDQNKKGIHNLRHSLAKNMLDNDIPITTISSTLGHSNIDTTSKTYIKIDIKNLKKCCLEVDE